jgi:hypothetical protein
MSGFYIDVSALQALRHALGATEAQMTAAFNKALRSTEKRLYKASASMMMKTVGLKDRKVMEKRIQRAVKGLGSDSARAGSARIWFGLNDVPVSAVRGTMKQPRGIRPQNRKRDVLGRFVKMKGARGATFTPKSPELAAVTYLNSFVANLRNKRTIWVRNSSGYIHEARIAINDPVNDAINEALFGNVTEILMEAFEKDLAGRVRGNVHLNSRGKRA